MDINSRKEIESLVDAFYEKVRKDDTIGFIFNEIVGDDWSHHLPVMYSFWETVLLHKQGYTGNPVLKHIAIDKQIPLQEQHYQRWLALWTTTIDSLYSGAVADEAKKRAFLMMNLISMKVQWAREGKTLQ